MAAGAPFAAAAHLRPDRPLPPPDAGPADREPAVLRVEHPARRRRADGARLGPPRRRAHHVGAAPMKPPGRAVSPLFARELDAAGIGDPALVEGYRQCRRLNARHGRSYYLATLLLPAGQAALRPRALRLRPLRRRPRRPDPGRRRGALDRFDRWVADVRAELDWGAAATRSGGR